jgi:putative ABC transport system ATP-binding protein
MSLLHQLHRQGRTILMVTHDPEIAAHTERTIHLRDGQVESVTLNERGMSLIRKERVHHASI